MTSAPATAAGSGRLFTRDFASLSLAVLVFFVAGGILLPVTPRYTEDVLLGDRIAVGIVIGVFAVSSLLMRPFAGRLADRRGRRLGLLLGATISIAAAAGHLLAVNVELLSVMRLVLGAAEALVIVAALAAATDMAPDHRRGEAISLVSLSLYLGIAIGPVIGEWVQDDFGYAAVWIVTAGLYAVSVGLAFVVPETLRHDPVDAAGESRTRLIHPRGIVPGLLGLCAVWGMGPFFAFLPLVVDDLGLGNSSPFLGAFAIVVVALRFLGARLPDRMGAARLAGSAFVATTVGLLVSGLAVARVVPVAEGLMVGTLVFGAGVAFTMPALMSMAVIGVRPDERGAVVGTAGLFIDAAFGLSPAVLGLVATWTDYPPTFLISAVVAAAGAAYLLVRRPGARAGEGSRATAAPSSG